MPIVKGHLGEPGSPSCGLVEKEHVEGGTVVADVEGGGQNLIRGDHRAE